MFVTKFWTRAKAESVETGKPIWKSDDGYYAVADAQDFPEDEAWEWTEVEWGFWPYVSSSETD